jgi:hypothetical protein
VDDEPTPSVCPECRSGKCWACDGTAWDFETDGPTVCLCAVDGHE